MTKNGVFGFLTNPSILMIDFFAAMCDGGLNMKRLFGCTGITALLAVLLLGFFSGMAWATYEVTNITTSASTGLTPQTGPAEDLEVEWAKPTMGAGDSLIGYVYIWNNSAALLDDTQLNQSTKEGSVAGTLDPPFLTKDNQDFASDDYDDIWYLHIKTSYLSLTEGPKLSDDVVVGPFNFDNVAPTGTVALDTSVPGQTATTSSVNPVTLNLTATETTPTVYLGNTSTFALATASAFANTLTFDVGDETGTKTIYAWFEDQAGNVSAAPVTLTFELTAGKTMSPAGAVTIEVGATQTFTILGAEATETFDWAIIEASPADVASFVGASTGVVSVEVSGDNEGTFKLQATAVAPSTGTYTSGTITVVQSYTPGDVNSDGSIDITDVLLTIDIIFGVKVPNAIEFAAANVDDTNQSIDITDLLKIIDIIFGL